jgi:hypothetical protein
LNSGDLDQVHALFTEVGSRWSEVEQDVRADYSARHAIPRSTISRRPSMTEGGDLRRHFRGRRPDAQVVKPSGRRWGSSPRGQPWSRPRRQRTGRPSGSPGAGRPLSHRPIAGRPSRTTAGPAPSACAAASRSGRARRGPRRRHVARASPGGAFGGGGGRRSQEGRGALEGPGRPGAARAPPPPGSREELGRHRFYARYYLKISISYAMI